MNRRSSLSLLCGAVIGTGAMAQINNPNAAGYLERGILMCENRNYQGSLDQLMHVSSLNPTAEQWEMARYYTCRALIGLGNNDNALEMIKTFRYYYPTSTLRADVMMMEGDVYFNRAAYADALAAYAKVDPMALTSARQDELNYRQAYSYLMLGEPDMAASLFRALQGKKEWRDAARFYLGYIAYSQGDYDLAMQYFRNLDTTREPAVAAPYYEAQIYFIQGKYDKCLAAARPLLASGAIPAFQPECNRLVGESLYALGRADEAVPYLWKYCAEAANPSPTAFYILGINEFDHGDWDASIKLFQQAIDNGSAMSQSAWLYLGQAYLKRGNTSQALMAFEKSYKMDYNTQVREISFYNYLVALKDGGRIPFGNSVALFEDFLSEYPNSPYAADVQRYVVNGYMSDNDYASALAAINRDKAPSTEMLRAKQRVLFLLGTREYPSGHVAEAIRHFTEAMELSRFDASIARQAEMWLGDCYYSRHNYEGAAKCYLNFIKATPAADVADLALARYDLGYARFSMDSYTDALANFSTALGLIERGDTELSSLKADILSRMGDCRYYLGDYAAAASDYGKAYDLNPEVGDYALFQLALMKGLLKDHGGKIATIDKLLERFPSSGLLPHAMLEKAESQVAKGDVKAAVGTYGKLVSTYPGTAPGRNGYLQLAITYINNGERAKGIDTYRKVITQFPSSDEARIAADDLKQIYAAEGRLNELVAFLNSVPNAPRYEASELEASAYQAAENAYINNGSTAALKSYVDSYPRGASRANALYYLADAAWSEGRPAEAQNYAMQVLITYPDSPVAEDALLVKAQAESEMGKTEIAHSSFLELESHASGAGMLHDARMGVMRTAMDLGKYADAVEAANKLVASSAINSHTDIAEIKFTRALAYERLGKHDKATSDWESLAANTADLYGAKSAYYLGQSFLDRGLTSRAKTVADGLISSDTPHRYWLARGFILYSDILRKEGNTFEANEYLKSLRSNYPGSEADIFQMIDTRLAK